MSDTESEGQIQVLQNGSAYPLNCAQDEPACQTANQLNSFEGKHEQPLVYGMTDMNSTYREP